MSLEFPSMLDYGLERSVDVLARAFADYFVQIPFSVPLLLKLVRVDSVDLQASRIFIRNGDSVGGAWVARRGWTCRVGGMAIVPEVRRAGVGRAVMNQLIAEATSRGDRTMVLEVIEQNTAAVALYRDCGFETVRRLLGFAGSPGGSAAPPGDVPRPDLLVEVDLREVAHAITRYGLPDLPWQLSGETIAQLSPPSVGYRLDDAWIAISDPSQPVITVHALVGRDSVEPDRLTTLLRAVMTKHAGKTEWLFTPKWPEELTAVITGAGLLQTALAQFQMQRRL